VLSLFGEAQISPGATTLIEAQTPQGTQPLVVVQKFGQGKVAAILTDSLWRWQLNPGPGTPYLRFWNQLIEWLLPEEVDLEKYELDLSSDVNQLFQGETVALKARLSGAENLPVGTRVTCNIQGPDGLQVPWKLERQATAAGAAGSFALFSADFKGAVPGLYRAVAEIEIDGKRIVSAPYTFFVKDFTPEKNPRPINAELLRALAANSGGRFCAPDEVEEALSSLRIQTLEQERPQFFSFWQVWSLIAAMLALLAGEWIVRKIRNMA
jgi:hypothetical protein